MSFLKPAAAFAVVTAMATAGSPANAMQCTTFVKQRLAKSYATRDFSALKGDAGGWHRAARRSLGSSVVGSVPSRGAIMVFSDAADANGRKSAAGGLGHVALVASIVDNRNITVDHANWRAGKTDLGVPVTTTDGWKTASVFNKDLGVMGSGKYAVSGFISPALFPRKKK